MNEYLIGISYHEPGPWNQWNRGDIEDYESSTGVFISANSADEAVNWGREIGERLLRYLNSDETLNYTALGCFSWHEKEIEGSGWEHCIGFFQHVKAGEMPDLTRMTTEAYAAWTRNNT